MPVKFSNDKPIFIQLAEILKSMIVSGKIKVNEKLPSVRELSLTYSINPNTVQKALQILEDDGLIKTDRTNGKFVVESSNLIKNQKEQLIQAEVNLFFEKMNSLGLSNDDIKKIINKVGK